MTRRGNTKGRRLLIRFSAALFLTNGVVLGQSAAPVLDRVVSSATLKAIAAPGSLVSFVGKNLADRPQMAQLDNAGNLPFDISGIGARIGGLDCRVSSVTPTTVTV